MAESKLTIKIAADVSKALSGIQSVTDKLNTMSKSTMTLKERLGQWAPALATTTTVLTAFKQILSSLAQASKECVEFYSIQQKAEVSLATTIKATGNAAGMSAVELYELASAFQSVTTYGDEAIIEVEKLFVSTTKISKEIMPDAIEATLDMAAALGEDLTSAARRLAKVLADPKSNLDALKDANIQLSEAQKEEIRKLQEVNNLYGAQSVVLESIESSFGGIAKALADTDTGKLTQISNVWGDIKEGLGETLLDTISPALDTLYEKLKNISDVLSEFNKNRESRKRTESFLSGEFDGTKLSDLTEEELRYIEGASAFGSWHRGFDESYNVDYEDAAARAERAGRFTSYDRTLYELVVKKLEEIDLEKKKELERINRTKGSGFDANALQEEKSSLMNSSGGATSSGQILVANQNKKEEDTEKERIIEASKVKAEKLSSFIGSNKGLSVSSQISEIYSKIATATDLMADATGSEKVALEEIIQSLYDQLVPLERIKNGIVDAEDATEDYKDKLQTVNDYLSTIGSSASTLVSSVFSFVDTLYGNQISAIDSLLSESQSKWDKYLDDLDEKQEMQKDSLSHLYDEGLISLEEYNAATKQMYDDKASAEEKAVEEEEKLQKKKDELGRKQFEANKANQISQAVMNGAMAITSIWAQHASNTVMAGILTGLASATVAAQIATISASQYTPLAAGGIVTKPTYALLGEAGTKEAVLPLTETNMKRAGFASASDDGVINIHINIGTAYDGEQLSRDVFNGIERAQRTGLLPKWRYA